MPETATVDSDAGVAGTGGYAGGDADKLFQAALLLDEFFDSYDPYRYVVDDATALLARMTRTKRRLNAASLNTARRLEKAHVHKNQGFKNAGSWLASLTDQPVGQASDSLGTAKALENHPEVKEAFDAGQLSEAQAKEIASAAEVSPEDTRELLDNASRGVGLGETRRRCSEIRSAASKEEDEILRHERIRKTRFCRTWVDSEGAGHLEAKMTTDALAVLRTVLGVYEKDVFCEARRSGRRETRQAYMADALIAMAIGALAPGVADPEAADSGAADPEAADSADPDSADTAGTATTTSNASGRRPSYRPRALLRITLAGEALLRGHTEPGEKCVIPGLGPVSVTFARELISDAILELVVKRGTDVTTVVSDSRYVRKALQIALEERDPVCVAPGCTTSDPLERDHWRVDYGKDGPTELDNLARLCPWHHHLKTYRGWKLDGGPGQWRFLSPEEAAAEKAASNPHDQASEPPAGESRAGPPNSGRRDPGGQAQKTRSGQKTGAKDPPQQTLL